MSTLTKYQDDDQNSNTDIELEIDEPKKRLYVYIQPNDILSLWAIVEDQLKSIKAKHHTMNEIVGMIQKIINAHFTNKKNISTQILSEYLDELSMKKQQLYQNELIPYMAKLALDISNAFQQEPIKLLLQGEKEEQKFTKYQIAVLLSNMFFCTLHKQPDLDNFPLCFDFSKLYMKGTDASLNNLKKEKLKFLFNYFEQVYNDKINLDLCVSFERVNYSYGQQASINDLKKSNITKKSLVEVYSDKSIESGRNLIQVTFANKLIGGGVLNRGALQEEIRYLISPECLVGILLFSELQDNEAIVIQGAQQVSDYEGYGCNLTFKGPYYDDQLEVQEENNMLNVVIVGMDAIDFSKVEIENEKYEHNYQFEQNNVMRDIAKAYTAFRCDNVLKYNNRRQGIITGNWGCGDFKGDKELKFLIQWIAASWCKRELYYCTHNDQLLKAKIEEIYQYLKSTEYTLYQILQFIGSYQVRNKIYSEISLFDYICLLIN
ncbi:poly(ADP-ribose) glycohydrolase (macronuclear) [Tetrahymena thermophila SB210]|uniref:poly(ADP-ribose) glycohydrolase n=1 Tax=Tetrahymena thermophila (strain SB210) TaxID=312017 RepID=Q23CV5_TETTS|nr:poly(ADP-ribose) glycohydrolase [Tetrahymena thermophila SB210]EAR94378.1 poly(ADP-ribose) glycohydrolase [Tetrahymena thermophila SB210]|eukprot:XP_001014931.1 poly(ADP-ribose) glycohydrolase [Tetrahymena thermophila SB210]